jgi:transposase
VAVVVPILRVACRTPIRYLADNGTKWRAIPVDSPPWDQVYAFFRRWRDHGLVREFHDRFSLRVPQGSWRFRQAIGPVSETTLGFGHRAARLDVLKSAGR